MVTSSLSLSTFVIRAFNPLNGPLTTSTESPDLQVFNNGFADDESVQGFRLILLLSFVP